MSDRYSAHCDACLHPVSAITLKGLQDGIAEHQRHHVAQARLQSQDRISDTDVIK